jgi:hypothetical protein
VLLRDLNELSDYKMNYIKTPQYLAELIPKTVGTP